MTAIDTTKIDTDGFREGQQDYTGRAQDVDAGTEDASWAWPLVDADEAYLNAVGTDAICRRLGVDEDAWDEIASLWCAAFRRGYNAAHDAA